MQSTTITYLPTPVPDIEYLARGEVVDISQTYPAAAYNGEVLEFEHKLTLSTNGDVVQVMSKDPEGLFTVALPQDAYSIDDDFVGIEMHAPVSGSNGQEFAMTLFKDDTTRNAVVPGTTSETVMTDTQNNPPRIILAEAVHTIGTSIIRELNFIGTTDVRTGFTARVTIRPGETVYVKRNASGDLVFQF